MGAKEVRNELQHVVHLCVATLVRRLSGRHGVGAHPETFDPAVNQLIGFVDRDVIVDQIAEARRNLSRVRANPTWKAGIERAGPTSRGLHV